MENYQKPMFSEDGGHRPLLTAEELRDACIHTAATVVVAFVYGCEFGDCQLDDDGYKWPTSISRIELRFADDWRPSPRARRSTKQDPWLSPSTMAEGLISSS